MAGAEGDVDAIVAELASLHDQLAALPTQDFGGRYRLHQRQDQLRDLAAVHHRDRDGGGPMSGTGTIPLAETVRMRWLIDESQGRDVQRARASYP
jgi:hypothetical protein